MNNNFIALFLSFFSGISTIFGFFIILFDKKKNILYYSLSFAAGVMLTVSFIDLIPESFEYLSSYFFKTPTILFILIFFSIGVIISFLIDRFLPTNTDNIYRVGVISLIAIIIHNIPEGIATYLASSIDIKLGVSLAIAITLHNIPEGIAISLPIYHSTNNKFKAFIYTMIAGLSEFFGAIITMFFLKKYITNMFIGFLLSIIAGIMFQISFYELLPEAKKCSDKKNYIYFFIGFLIMFLSTRLT